MNVIKSGGRIIIGKKKPCFIVAEISANHGQDFKRAVSLIKKAKECGVDAVKFQAYTPDTLTIDADNEYFRIKHPKWGGKTLYRLYKDACIPWSWFKKLKSIADDEGLLFLCTAFDRTSVDFLDELKVPFHKISSFELVDLELIEYAARTMKPLILSTGMATVSEIKEAYVTAKKAGARGIVLLKCVSSYPAKPREMNLRTIPDMEKLFKCPIGFSDHSMDIGASIAAVCLGAKMIEKHFTLSRNIKTPDSFFSLEPHEMKSLVRNIRIAEDALGKIKYGLTADQYKNRIFRRSLFVVEDIKRGEMLTSDNVRSIRPGFGLMPKHLKKVLGKRAVKNISKGTPLKPSLLNFR